MSARQAPRDPISLSTAYLLLLFTVHFSIGPAHAQSTKSLYGDVGKMVARGEIKETKLAGFSVGGELFREVPRSGGILIGFDVGLGDSYGDEHVFALRPLYRTATGDHYLEEHGLFRDEPMIGGRPLKSKVTRTMRVKARIGYAVGEVHVKSSISIQGMGITFMRIKDGALDPRDAYVSEWIGTNASTKTQVLSSYGQLIAGVSGRDTRDQIRAVGLIYLDRPVVAATVKLPTPEPDEKKKPSDNKKATSSKSPDAPATEKEDRAEKEEEAPAQTNEAVAKTESFPWGVFVVFALMAVPAFLYLFMRANDEEAETAEGRGKEKRELSGVFEPDAPNFGDPDPRPRASKQRTVAAEEDDSRPLDFRDPEPPDFGAPQEPAAQAASSTSTSIDKRSEAFCPKPKDQSAGSRTYERRNADFDPEPPLFE